ncbi:MAG: hypothetical protein O3C40_29580 [Planctomycetota bacterium]|nr:hypothetical protein [Planctomycetota bacterium]
MHQLPHARRTIRPFKTNPNHMILPHPDLPAARTPNTRTFQVNRITLMQRAVIARTKMCQM